MISLSCAYASGQLSAYGGAVEDIDMNYKFDGRAGDVDIVTKSMNIEVKSGNKMKLTQSPVRRSVPLRRSTPGVPPDNPSTSMFSI